MLCRVKVTGSGVACEGEDGQEQAVPHGVYTLELSDGRYSLTEPAGEYLIVAPEPHGPDGYLARSEEKGRHPSANRRGMALATGCFVECTIPSQGVQSQCPSPTGRQDSANL